MRTSACLLHLLVAALLLAASLPLPASSIPGHYYSATRMLEANPRLAALVGTDRAAYLDLVTGPMLAAVVAQGAATYVDVFCEPLSAHAFTEDEARVILRAGRAAGLAVRVHGNQLGPGPGVRLACELGAVSVDHCTYLTDVDIGYFNADMRLTPPLRQGADRDALRAALADGTIDALVSDHNPVAEDMKNLPFAEAEPGASGLELLLALALRWGADQGLPLTRTLARVTCDPVRVLGDALGSLASSAGRLVEGGVADICLFDPDVDWSVTPEQLCSQGKHTPFAFASTGMALRGRVRTTLVAGTIAFDQR